jgi:hypothetical protein
MKRLILDLEKHSGNAEVILDIYLDDRKVAGRMLRIPPEADAENLIDFFFDGIKTELKVWVRKGILTQLQDNGR